MVEFFYRQPIWLTAMLVLGLSLAIGLGSAHGLRRLLRLHASDDEIEVAVNLMQVVAAYIGIMIAFAGVQVWQEFADAQDAVHREAAVSAELYRDLTTYGPETAEVRSDLREYVASVVNDEWQLLALGGASPATEDALFNLFDAIGRVQPQDARDGAIYDEVFDKLNDLVELRRDRLIHSKSGMPLILWIVGLGGSILIVAYTATFPPTRVNRIMIAGTSLALGLIFLFILVVDRPYLGRFRVDNGELAGLSDKFDHIDRLSAAAKEKGPPPR